MNENVNDHVNDFISFENHKLYLDFEDIYSVFKCLKKSINFYYKK
jgi:hypothetical protein